VCVCVNALRDVCKDSEEFQETKFTPYVVVCVKKKRKAKMKVECLLIFTLFWLIISHFVIKYHRFNGTQKITDYSVIIRLLL